MKPSAIYDMPIARLTSAVQGLGLKPYAVSQIVSWLYKRLVTSFDEMSNLSRDARETLTENYFIGRLHVDKIQLAPDGTRKYAFRLTDGSRVESVLIPSPDGRLTLCISTQVGCAMGCAFCRTASMGFMRDLTQGEILGQVIEVQRLTSDEKDFTSHIPRHTSHVTNITNIVFMGMGEPLANYDAVSGAIEILLDERAFNLSKRRITVSTSGLLPQLDRFSREHDVKIAISLNATTDEVRSKLMPLNRRYGIASIMKFCRDYSKRSRYRVTFEYVMIKNVNDTGEDLKRLVRLLTGIRAKVNLIPFNSFPDSGYDAPDEDTVRQWLKILSDKGIQANLRISRGQGILAACGQLAA